MPPAVGEKKEEYVKARQLVHSKLTIIGYAYHGKVPRDVLDHQPMVHGN
jgi:hypothetical protein